MHCSNRLNISHSVTRSVKPYPKNLKIADYFYDLSEDRIAQKPLEKRDASKLLVYSKGEIGSDVFSNIANHIPENSLLILNNTRVINARLLFETENGQQVEIFCLEPADTSDFQIALQQYQKAKWICLVGNLRKWKGGILKKNLKYREDRVELIAKLVNRIHDSFIIEFCWNVNISFAELIEIAGATPLPPYIKRKANDEDKERYQTVYANIEGSVASPTAGLHFTDKVFRSFEEKDIKPGYLTLHVGAGTFKLVKSKTLEKHYMHSERFSISYELLKYIYDKIEDGLICVGTTSLRAIESLYYIGLQIHNDPNVSHHELSVHQWMPYDMKHILSTQESIEVILNYLKKKRIDYLNVSTGLLAAPGFEFRFTKGLVTNFHQPGSTLLLLIAAFVGNDWKKIYNYALQNDYRFLSYGDSSILFR